MNKYLLALVVIFSILSINLINCAEGDRVVVLTDANFEETVMNSEDMWFIEFYAPWCGHCKALTPHWDRLSDMVHGEGDIRIAKLDADSNKAIGAKFGVNSFPQIKLMGYGKKDINNVKDFEGARDAETMEQFLLDEKNTNAPVRFEQLVDQATYDKFCVNIKRGACLVAVLPHIYDSSATERNGYLARIKAIAEKHKTSFVTFMWAQQGDQYLLEESLGLGAGYPTMVAISDKKKVNSVMRGAFTDEKIEAFVSNLLSGKESLSKFRQNIPKIETVTPWNGEDQKPESHPEEDL